MNLLHRRPRGAFPVADRSRDGDLYETEHPRLAAIRFLREKIADHDAGLDPYDETVLVVDVHLHETVWAARAVDLTGLRLDTAGRLGGGARIRCIVEADVRTELGLDQPGAPVKDDVPLASRAVAAAGERLLVRAIAAVEDRPRLSLVEPRDLVHEAAVGVDCECGAPAGLECRCSDQVRLASPLWRDDTTERQVH